MAHPPVCPCPNCRGSGGWGWLLLVAACAAAVIACCFAVHAAVAWLAGHVVFDVLAVWLLWERQSDAPIALPSRATFAAACGLFVLIVQPHWWNPPY